MIFLGIILLVDSNEFKDLQEIAKKIIPSDPWAIVTQLVATFIMFIIASKFLFKPVRKYIKARQDYIHANLEEANNKNKEADENLANSKIALSNARKESKEIVEQAKVTALNEKDKILESGETELKALRDKAHKDNENELLRMKKNIEDEVVDVALAAASKVIEREVNKEDNKKIIDSFINDNGNN